jgi:hypothetical protein
MTLIPYDVKYDEIEVEPAETIGQRRCENCRFMQRVNRVYIWRGGERQNYPAVVCIRQVSALTAPLTSPELSCGQWTFVEGA